MSVNNGGCPNTSRTPSDDSTSAALNVRANDASDGAYVIVAVAYSRALFHILYFMGRHSLFKNE
jgi:hypothetical protein